MHSPRKPLAASRCEGTPAVARDGKFTEAELVGLALALGAGDVAAWSAAEGRLASRAEFVPAAAVRRVTAAILAGDDPLGAEFCKTRPSVDRRAAGATFTPSTIVEAMVDACADRDPQRVVDPGCGSGRFLLAAARRFPKAELVGIELDPLPAMLCRANLAVSGLADRAQVKLGDYREAKLPRVEGQTLFLGNPPYVRHHRLGARWKQWLTDVAAGHGFAASQLAGLHVHFFMATAAKATAGDYGAFVTAAEWLDVNYGSLVRELFLGPLGGRRIVVIEPTALPFPDAATTAAITSFTVGAKPQRIKLQRVASLDELQESKGKCAVRRERLEAERRWSQLTRRVRKGPAGTVELGELCRVHRGQVTGLNKLWIAGEHSVGLPDSVLFRSVTRARELFLAGPVLREASRLRHVIDLPDDLDQLDSSVRRAVERFLATARRLNAHRGYVASNRKAWWSVGLREPAPILTTYMARRPPAFVRNRAGARHINIAHGIYPRQKLPDRALRRLADYLGASVCTSQGRTYAGGLTKFEPREVERLLVPAPERLAARKEI